VTTKTHFVRALTVATVLAAAVISAAGPASAAPQQSCLIPAAAKQSDDPNAAAKALDRAVAEMRIAGRTAEQIDATLSSRYGIKAVGQKSAPQTIVSPLSDRNTLSVPAPAVYYDQCARYWWVLATWDFSSIVQMRSDAGSCNNCAVGPRDVFGMGFTRDVADPGSWSASSWGATSVYPFAYRGIGHTSNHGVTMEDQDRFCRGGICAADDYNMFHGQLVYTIDIIGCGYLTVHSKYGHSWSSVSLTGVSIGYPEIGISWSNDTNSWNKANIGPSNTVHPC
jgi:hypothetical protein